MMALIFSRVSPRTKGESLMTRETVFLETLARRAMSLIVARLRPGAPFSGAASGCCRVRDAAGFRDVTKFVR